MFVLQAEYFDKRLFPGTPWMHSIQLLWKCTSSAVFCRVPQMHISCSSFAKFLHLIFLHIHHWIPLVFFPGINLILSYPHSPLHWILLIWGLTSSHSESHIPRDWSKISSSFSGVWVIFAMCKNDHSGRLSNCGWICICHKYFSPIFVTNICHEYFSNICCSPLPRGDFAHAGVKFTEVSSYSGSLMLRSPWFEKENIFWKLHL